MQIPPKTLGKIAWTTVCGIGKTLSITEHGGREELFRKETGPVIFSLWHGRLFIPLYYKRDRGIHIIVSEHRDGEIINTALDSAGFRTVRGSTTRGGARALVQLMRLVERGEKVGFTSDGPRGPRWQLQPGVVYLAAKTGLPVVPVSASASRAYYFNSWDSFQLPLPFARGVFAVGEPYPVTGGLDDANIEFHRAEMERRMVALAREADRLAGAPEGK